MKTKPAGKTEAEKVTAKGTTEGATGGHATRKSAAADAASQTAHQASANATGDDCKDGDCEAAADAHDAASEVHSKAMMAQAKAGNADKASEHAKAMVAHDAMAEAFRSGDKPVVESSMKQFFPEKVVVKAEEKTAESGSKEIVKAASRDIVRCRASGSKLPASEPWVQDQPVKFCYMPGGLHTITAGFSGPITKGRDSSINLTIDVDPERDAPVCQSSMESIKAEQPKQDLFGCYEHDEKKASVWADSFEAGQDPVHGEPAILLAARPSGDGANDVNAKNWRSWSPSFGTNAEYGKCKCRACEATIQACDCDKPQFYFPEGVRGSLSNPAQITGVDGVVGTLTNKPAFRAMPPVKAKLEDGTVTAGGAGSGRHAEGHASPLDDPASRGMNAAKRENSAASATEKADKASEVAQTKGWKSIDEKHDWKGTEDAHRDAAIAHTKAAELNYKAGNGGNGFLHESKASWHNGMANTAHENAAANGTAKATDSFIPDTEAILASMPLVRTVDDILVGMTGYKSAAAELDAEESILKACSGVAA